jgi:hypothetical protein
MSLQRYIKYYSSIVATATFFATSVVTARFVYKGSLPPVRTTDWTLGMHGNTFLALQGVSIAISTLLYLLVCLYDSFFFVTLHVLL